MDLHCISDIDIILNNVKVIHLCKAGALTRQISTDNIFWAMRAQICAPEQVSWLQTRTSMHVVDSELWQAWTCSDQYFKAANEASTELSEPVVLVPA